MATHLHPRFADRLIREALADTPVVAVNGARQIGKSTLVGAIAAATPGARLVTLDDPAELESARFDPAGFVDHDGLLVIDEVQRAPELLAAIKASVDRDRRPGRYLITGSTRLLSLAEMSESLAGRVEIVELWPLTQAELAGTPPSFVDALLSGDPSMQISTEVERRDYAVLACDGGYPEPRTRSGHRRAAWFESYATTVLERMLLDVAKIERSSAMPTLLRMCAARTGNELNVADIAKDIAVPYRTVGTYLSHLEQVFLVQLLPAWSRNLSSKVARRPKLHIVDSGLAAHLLGVDAHGLEAPAGPIGALLETYVAMQLRAQLPWAEQRSRLFHFRDRGGIEVDFVLERSDGRVAGIEVKASTTVRGGDFNGLRLLRDRLGDQFLGGVVLHTGTTSQSFGPKLASAPLAALWQVH